MQFLSSGIHTLEPSRKYDIKFILKYPNQERFFFYYVVRRNVLAGFYLLTIKKKKDHRVPGFED